MAGVFFNGYTARLSYLLTAEHRTDGRLHGLHKRMEPFEDFFRVRTKTQGIQAGLGAWEVAARFSTITLYHENIIGNNMSNFPAGLT